MVSGKSAFISSARWGGARALVLAASLVTLQGVGAQAATKYWYPPGTPGTWDTLSSNWSDTLGGSANATWAAGDSAYFSATNYASTPFTAELASGAAISAAGITFDAGAATVSSAGGGAALTLSGDLRLNATAAATTLDSSLGDIRLGASQNWTNNSGSLLSVNSGVTNAANLIAYTLTLNGSGAGGTSFNGAISNGGTTGTLALTVNTTGAGITTLAAANTYSGATTLTAGNLRLTNTAALTNSALKLNGGVLQLRSDSSATFATASTALTGTVGIDVDRLATGSGATLSLGAVSLANNTTLNVTGANGCVLGLGAVTLASGNATINTGTADLVTASVGTTSSGNFTKTGSGTWTLNGTLWAKGYPGVITVSGGTLKLGVNNAIDNHSGYGVKVLLNGGTLDLAGYNQNLGSIDTTATTGAITNSSSTTAATLTVDDQNQAAFVQTYGGVLTDGGGSGKLNLSVTSKDSYGHSTTLSLTSTGSTYTGVTTVQGGRSTDSVPDNQNILKAASLANGGIASSIGAATSAAGNIVLNYGGTLQYTGGSTSTDRLFSIGGNYGGIIESSGSGAISFTNTGTIGFNGSTSARYMALGGTNTDENSMAATIANNTGATTLTKAGSGTWVISNSGNSYTGPTIVGGGVLKLPSLGNGGTASTLGASSSAAANLVLAGGTLRYAGATNQSTDRLFTIAATGGTLDSSGAGTLSFTNAGANLSSDPADRTIYTTQATPPTGMSLVRGAVLATDLVPGMTVSGTGVGTATAVSSVSGGVNVTFNGTLGTWGNKTLSFGSADRALTLTGSNGGANTIAGSLADSPKAKLSLAKTGSGMWVLSGASSYTGATIVGGGTLRLHGASLMSNVVVNAGRLDGSGGSTTGSITVGDGSGTADALIAPGESIGTLTAGGVLTFNSDGVLQVELDTTSLSADRIVANGVNLLAGPALNVSDLNPAVLGSVQQFTLIDNTSASPVSGAFAGYGEGAALTVGGNSYAISYVGGTGNDVVLTSIIPEPATAVMLGVGLMTLAGCRRRRG